MPLSPTENIRRRGLTPVERVITAFVKAVDETLSDRVAELIRSGKTEPLLSTIGEHGALVELAGRVEGLEEAIREIALADELLAEQDK